MGLRSSRATVTRLEKKTVSSAISGTSDWTKIVRRWDRCPRPGSRAPPRATLSRTFCGVVEVVGQRLHVGQQDVAVVFVLQAHAVGQRADVVPQVQRAGRPVAGQYSFLFESQAIVVLLSYQLSVVSCQLSVVGSTVN